MYRSPALAAGSALMYTITELHRAKQSVRGFLMKKGRFGLPRDAERGSPAFFVQLLAVVGSSVASANCQHSWGPKLAR